MDIILPKGKARKIQCECGRSVQHPSYPSHILSARHVALMKEKSVIKVEHGIFNECSIQSTCDPQEPPATSGNPWGFSVSTPSANNSK